MKMKQKFTGKIENTFKNLLKSSRKKLKLQTFCRTPDNLCNIVRNGFESMMEVKKHDGKLWAFFGVMLLLDNGYSQYGPLDLDASPGIRESRSL